MKLIRIISLLLAFSLIFTVLVACNSKDDNLTTKEKFVNQIKKDFDGTGERLSIDFTADEIAHGTVMSASFSVNIKISDNNIYFGNTLYNSVKRVDSLQISYDFLVNTNETVSYEEVVEIVEDIKKCKSCFILESEDPNIDLKVAVVKSSGVYYFLTLLPETNALIRIHRTKIMDYLEG